MKNFDDLLTIAIPVYNEGENILTALKRLREHIPVARVLLVYDKEEDTTLTAFNQAPEELKVNVFPLRNKYGRGALNAIKTGMEEATTKYVVVMMADLCDPPEVVETMVEKAEKTNSAVVCASRYMKGGSQIGGPKFKGFLSRTAGKILHFFAGLPTHDPTNSFKLYRTDFLKSQIIESNGGFEIGIELTVKAWEGGHGVAEVPTSWRDRTQGKSNFKLFSWLPNYLKWFFRAFRKSWSFKVLQLLFAASWFFLFTPESKSFPLLVETVPSANAITFSEKDNGFILPKSEEIYRIKGFDWHGIKIPANVIVPMINSKYPLYETNQFYGTEDTIDIDARDGNKVLCYERFFQVVRKTDPLFRFFLSWGGILLCILLNLLIRTSSRDKIKSCTPSQQDKSGCKSALLKNPIAYAIATATAIFLSLPPPCSPIETGLDPSWTWLQNFFAFSPEGNGVSFFFTSGPLGFMMNPVLPKTYTAALIINIIYSILTFAILNILFLCRKESRREQWLLIAGLLLPISSEWRWSLMIPVTAMAAVTSDDKRECALYSTIFSFLATYNLLLKFTLPMMALGTFVTGIIFLVFSQRKTFPVFLGSVILSSLIFILTAILAFFPSFDAFSNWFAISMEISRGYAKAMITPADSFFTLMPLILFSMSCLYILLPVNRSFRRRFLHLLLVLPFIGIITKYSLVRCGFDKLCLWGTATAWCMILLCVFFNQQKDLKQKAKILSILCAGIAIFFVSIQTVFGTVLWNPVSISNLKRTVLFSSSAQDAIHKSNENLNTYSEDKDILPPSWEVVIGTNSFSCFPIDLTPGIIFRKANFKPFSIVQGYSAYTEKLDAIGAEAYDGTEKSPKYLIVGGDAIEQRNIITDTPQTWNAILRNYVVCKATPKRVLLEKRGDGGIAKKIPPLEKEFIMQIGEWFELASSSKEQFVSIDWQPSLYGRFMNLFYRETQYSLSLQYEDGSTYRMRIIPEVLVGPVPLARIPPRNEIEEIFKCRKVVKIKLDTNAPQRMNSTATIRTL